MKKLFFLFTIAMVSPFAPATTAHASGIDLGDNSRIAYQKQLCQSLFELPKSVFMHPADYPLRNGGKPIRSFRRSEPEDSTYNPTDFTSPSVLEKSGPGGLAESMDPRAQPRRYESKYGPINVDAKGRPEHPLFRTGIGDRGVLYKWGVNKTAGVVITRKNKWTGEYEYLVIQREESLKEGSDERALPGGFVDDGEIDEEAMLREVLEEIKVDLGHIPRALIYEGLVDDYRTTDHAWIEESTYHVHLGADIIIEPKPGDGVASVGWRPLREDMLFGLYASHGEIVRKVIERFSRMTVTERSLLD